MLCIKTLRQECGGIRSKNIARPVGTGLMGEVQSQGGRRQCTKPGLRTLVMAGCCLFAESGVSCQGGVLERVVVSFLGLFC